MGFHKSIAFIRNLLYITGMNASKYFVLIGKKWGKCEKALPTPNGSLEFVLSDGTFGFAPASKWMAIHYSGRVGKKTI